MMGVEYQHVTDNNATNSAINSVCAVVVTYFPDQGFDERICTLLPQVGMLVIVDNTPDDKRICNLKKIYGNDARICVIENSENLGIATALNQGLKTALENHYKWIVTLDQDTKPYSDMVRTLLNVSEGCGVEAVVIGGNYFDYRKKRLRISVAGADGFAEQKTVITAGCLINAEIARMIGGFREDYFIDQVDHEFCLRARAHGYRVLISSRPVMEHSIGGADRPHRFLLGLAPPDHSPLRKYYIARNSLVTVMEYWKLEPLWCLDRLVGVLLEFLLIVLLQKNPVSKLMEFLRGIADGACRQMGARQTK
jgi:rhamnosyltransferase